MANIFGPSKKYITVTTQSKTNANAVPSKNYITMVKHYIEDACCDFDEYQELYYENEKDINRRIAKGVKNNETAKDVAEDILNKMYFN